MRHRRTSPVEFLTSDDVALEDGTCYVKEVGKEVPAVEIPYADRNGEQVATRYRIAAGGDDKFRWERGSTTTLYGLHRLEEAEKAGTYCWSRVSLTVTSHGTEVSRPGVPGWITGGRVGLHLDGIPKIFVWSSRMKPVRSCGGLWSSTLSSGSPPEGGDLASMPERFKDLRNCTSLPSKAGILEMFHKVLEAAMEGR